ncbi:hypothetical protein [Actinoplanes ianthinogenes]|uniref:hypothetical protein n=1 Tax=Actinoplanes ianthinogenes TaxID=122358 RepID=UPI0016702006|nr:hypothetical protein [Actinoplanes ianthinogenes]
MTKASNRTVAARIIAVVLAVWSGFLALHGPAISDRGNRPGRFSSGYDCPAPLSYVLPNDMRDYIGSAPWGLPDGVQEDCRDRAIGAGVTIGLFGNVVALLLGFARPPARRAEPDPAPPSRPAKPPAPPVTSAEDEDGLWNPGLRHDRLSERPRADGEPS